MIVIRKEEADLLKRPFGRQTYRLFSHRFDRPVDSIIFYLSVLPTGQFDEHYHTQSEEMIFFPEGGKMRVNGEIVQFEREITRDCDAGLVAPCPTGGKARGGGFGSMLLTRVFEAATGGEVDLQFARDGLHWTATIPSGVELRL